MKGKNVIFCFVLTVFISLVIHASVIAQQVHFQIDVNDSLSLPAILQQVLLSYPTVAKAQEAIQAAEAGIGLAKSGYYPSINANAGYTRIGPVPELTIPDLGHFSLVPNNNYNASVSIYENIYDFEKTARSVQLEKSNKEISEKNVELVQQRLTLITSVSYYSLIYLQNAIKIKETQIETLQKHIDFVTLKEQTGSATQYEIISTKVRLSNAENQKVDLETSKQTQQAILNSLMGLPVTTPLKVQGNFISTQPEISPDSLIFYALDNRHEMNIARLKEKHAQLNLRSVKAMNNPTLGLFLAGGLKNGYIPDINKLTPNYTAGIGLNVPIFDATRRRNTILLANTQISMAQSDILQTSLDISTEVYQNETSLLASMKKIDQSILQVKQAEEALNLATVSYKTGAITNLDLLDAETALEESRVNLLRARIEYAINVVRLNISLGKPIQ
jgi:outer membrane protein TolC